MAKSPVKPCASGHLKSNSRQPPLLSGSHAECESSGGRGWETLEAQALLGRSAVCSLSSELPRPLLPILKTQKMR